MNATKIQKAQGTRAERKARGEPPWNVVLHNSWHPMSWVVYAVVRAIPGTSVKRAASVMWEAHTEGRAVAKSCHKELAELYEERLRAKGLTVSTEPVAQRLHGPRGRTPRRPVPCLSLCRDAA